MIYYDISDLMAFCHGNRQVSGIQRTSTLTLTRLAATSRQEQCRAVACHVETGRLLSTDIAFFRRDGFDIEAFARHFDIALPGPDVTEDATPMARVAAPAYRAIRHRLARLACAARVTLSPRWQRPAFGDGDVLYLPGGIWSFEGYMAALERAHRKKGLRIVMFVHDLIALVVPDHVEKSDFPRMFDRWLRRMSAISSRFVVCSQSTRRDLERYFAERGIPPVPISVVPHALEFVGAAEVTVASPTPPPPSLPEVSDRVRQAARDPFVLCVGTMEARKNNGMLARAWMRVGARHGAAMPRLVFAGKRGWRNSDFEELLRSTGNLAGRIEIVETPSDAELADLYRSCLFTVFPSAYEGWGLPIGESLWFGRPVIASSTSSMPEVGGDLVDYIDPADPTTLEAAIEALLDADYRATRCAAIVAAPKRRWTDVADGIWTELTHVAAEPRPDPPAR